MPTIHTLTPEAIASLRADHLRLQSQINNIKSTVSDSTNRPRWFLRRSRFKNESGESIPPYAVMRVTGESTWQGKPCLNVAKPDSTFRTFYVLNGAKTIAAGGYGYTQATGASQLAACDGSPSAGAGLGPKSGQWTLASGVPAATIVSGIYDPAANIAEVRWLPIQTTFHVTLATNILAGASDSITLPGGQSVTATNWSADTDLESGDKCQLTLDLDSGTWYLIKSGSATGGGSGTNTAIFNGVLYSNLAWDDLSGQAVSLGSYTTGIPNVAGPITVNNPLNLFGETNDFCVIAYHYPTAAYYLLATEKTGNTGIWHSLAIDDIDAGNSGTVELSDGTEVEATNWSDDVDITGGAEGGDKIHVYRDTSDGQYYIAKSGGSGGIELYNATLSSALTSGSSTAATGDLTAWSDGSTVSGETVANPYHLCAASGETVLVGKDMSSGSAVYKVIMLEFVTGNIVTDSLVDSATNTTKIQKKTRGGAYMSSESSDTTASVVDLVSDTYVIDVLPDSATATTKLQKKTLDVRRFPTTNSDSAATDWLTLESQQIVTDVEDSGSALTRDVLTIYVMPNTGTPSAGTVFNTGTSCP